MTRPNLRVLVATAPIDKTLNNNDKSTLQLEIKERLSLLANSIKNDAYAGVDSSKLIAKWIKEIEILRCKSEIGGLLL